MTNTLFFVTCSLLLVGVPAQPSEENRHCCMPGKQVQLTYASNVVTGNGSYYRQLVRGAYDFSGRRYGSISNVTYIDGTRITVRIIFLAREGVQYYITNGTCTKLGDALVEPKRCITHDYREVGNNSIGNGEMAVKVFEMAVNDSKHGMYGNTFLSVSARSCVPIGQSSMLYLGVPPRLDQVSDSGGYSNFTNTISHPDFWFTPPSYCPPAGATVGRSIDVPQEHLYLSRLAMIGGWSP